MNINGLLSKIDSLDNIIDNVVPDVVVLNEVKIRNSGKLVTFFKKKGYDVLCRTKGPTGTSSLTALLLTSMPVNRALDRIRSKMPMTGLS